MQIYWISTQSFLTSFTHHPYLYAIYILACILALKMKWLTPGGCIAAFYMALVFHSAGLATFLLPLWLLVGGTAVSKMNPSDEQSHGRTGRQVLANGGIGALCLLLSTLSSDYMAHVIFYVAYYISFSVSICDTFSSEIGKRVKGKTIDVISFRRTVAGLSGGISIAGTLGGLLGLVPVVAIFQSAYGLRLDVVQLILAMGFAGMLLDSMLGSMLQAKYEDVNGYISEYPGEGFVLYKGYAWCNNDTVNFISNAAITAGFLLMAL